MGVSHADKAARVEGHAGRGVFAERKAGTSSERESVEVSELQANTIQIGFCFKTKPCFGL
jgi:hypothetical protein